MFWFRLLGVCLFGSCCIRWHYVSIFFSSLSYAFLFECFFTLMLYFGNEEQSEMAKKQLKYILQTRLVNKRYKCFLPNNLSQRWAGRSVVGEGSSVSMLATTWNVLVHLGRPVSEFKCIDMLEDFSPFWRANL